MIKKWLIRTKNNHILGPVSKEKIRELIANGTIKGDDEVCSGNGYWIYVREQDLISKYILGDSSQSFNPVQEAKSSEISAYGTMEFDKPEEAVVLSNDLEDQKTNDDITTFDLDISSIKEQEVLEDPSDATELVIEEEPPVLQEMSNPTPSKVVESNSKETTEKKTDKISDKAKTKKKEAVKSNTVKKKSNITVNILYLFAAIFLLSAIIAFKYKKNILNKINEQSSMSLFNNAVAQDLVPSNKKKSGKFSHS